MYKLQNIHSKKDQYGQTMIERTIHDKLVLTLGPSKITEFKPISQHNCYQQSQTFNRASKTVNSQPDGVSSLRIPSYYL